MATQTFEITMTAIEGASFWGETFDLGFLDPTGHVEPFAWSFQYFTSPGTAKSHLDFQPASGVGNRFGFETIRVLVKTIDDKTVEEDEHFTLTSTLTADDTVKIVYHLIIKDNDKFHCRFDFNGDGKVDDIELSYSKAYEYLDILDKHILRGYNSLDRTLDYISRLKEEASAATIDQELADTAFLLKLILSAVPGTTPGSRVAALGPPIIDFVETGYKVFITKEASVPRGAVSAFVDVLDVGNEFLKKNPPSFTKFIPIVGNIQDGVEHGITTAEYVAQLEFIEREINEAMGRLQASQKAFDHAIKLRDAIAECVRTTNPIAPTDDCGCHDGSSKAGTKYVMPDGGGSLGSSSSEGDTATPDAPGVISARELKPVRKAPMPQDVYLSLGNGASEILHAMAGNLGGSARLCMASTGGGDDRARVSAGAIYLDGGRGTDSVFVYESGKLASVKDILLKEGGPNATAEFVVGDNLLLVTQSIEKFTFREGSYVLSKGKLKFDSGDVNRGTIEGNSKDNIINGTVLPDNLVGKGGDDKLSGKSGSDAINGGSGKDILIGGNGRDLMTGGTGADDFDFNLVSEIGKTPTTRDRIRDFTHSTDDIVLSTIDANTKAGGNQKFKWIGTQGFHNKAGELRYFKENLAGTSNDKTLVQGDVNGDGKADFQIELTGLKTLTSGDFVL